MPDPTRLTVAVLGAGIVGLCAALEVQRAGHQVMLVERSEPGGRQAASYGNGAWLNPAAIMPISVPGLWRRLPGLLLDRGGYLVGDLPAISPWLYRFLMAGRTWNLIETCAAARFLLCKDTVEDHTALTAEAGCDNLIRRNGLLFVYPDRAAFLVESREWSMRRRFGTRFSELERDELHRLQPNLGPSYAFGVRLDDAGHVIDPGRYCASLFDLLLHRGAGHVSARAVGFGSAGGRLRAVRTDGDDVPCDKAIISAGIGSAALARAAGDPVPLVSERGYHVVVSDPGFDIPCGLMPSDGKVAVVATPQGVRVAGQVELAAVHAPPNWRRVENLLASLPRLFPSLGPRTERRIGIDRWMGHRPSTPDGLPCIGPASLTPDIVHAFGDGHTGLIQASSTGRLAAALITGTKPPFEPAPFSAQRFGG